MAHQRVDPGQQDVAGRAPFAVGLGQLRAEPGFETAQTGIAPGQFLGRQGRQRNR